MPGCKRCGACCRRGMVDLPNVPFHADAHELGRWLSYHGLQVTENQGHLAILLPQPCQHLVEQDGKCSCAIYSTRPAMCRDYLCEAARGISIPG